MNFSKSKYTTVWQCPKALWMKKYMPDKLCIDEGTMARMTAGNEVGDLAMGILGDYVEVTAYDKDKINLDKMIENTKDELAKETNVICEASFSVDGLYCAVDLLKKEEKGYSIYEVKSSTSNEDTENDPKEIYIADIAYQKYVLQKCGIEIKDTYLVQLNKDYIFDGTLDIQKLFNIINVNEYVDDQYLIVEAVLKKAKEIIDNPNEPNIDLDVHCNNPYKCSFFNYCSRKLPEYSVFNLYRMAFKKKIEYYKKGIISYEDLYNDGSITNPTRFMQIDHILNDRDDATINKDVINEFLDTLSYPLYFLDFETMQPVIPKYIGTHPYQQIPFQYSLHYIESEGGELKHKEFLGESGKDPRRALAEQLVRDIPYNVCTMAYNKAFECTRLKELAEAFPDLSNHLLNIRDNIVDLLIPFQHGGYYVKEMGGSFSIKSVLPALFPNDPELDYHALEDVHNGSEAMDIFPKIQYMPKEEQEKVRKNLLKYCGLDTLAMVKVWEKLVEVMKV